jgi:VWFA-related protein
VLTIGIILSILVASFAQNAPVFRANIDLVNIEVIVTDKKGNLVPGLTADDFATVEDGKPQTVRYFAAGHAVDSGRDLHLGLLLDVSESMGQNMRFTRSAAIQFLNSVVDAVDITVVDFDTEIRGARYDQAQFVQLVERIRQQEARGATALYDAIGVYLAGAADQEGRKIMLLYTDGGDNRSSMPFSDLLDVLKASDVTVYVIGQVVPQQSMSWGHVSTQLRRIAEVTGGQAFFPQSMEDLSTAYRTVLAQIRAGYTIGYLSTNDKADGAWRHVEVKVVAKAGRDYRVRARNGYYAPYNVASKRCGTEPTVARPTNTVPGC